MVSPKLHFKPRVVGVCEVLSYCDIGQLARVEVGRDFRSYHDCSLIPLPDRSKPEGIKVIHASPTYIDCSHGSRVLDKEFSCMLMQPAVCPGNENS